jgi:hypothetical protein
LPNSLALATLPPFASFFANTRCSTIEMMFTCISEENKKETPMTDELIDLCGKYKEMLLKFSQEDARSFNQCLNWPEWEDSIVEISDEILRVLSVSASLGLMLLKQEPPRDDIEAELYEIATIQCSIFENNELERNFQGFVVGNTDVNYFIMPAVISLTRLAVYRFIEDANRVGVVLVEPEYQGA